MFGTAHQPSLTQTNQWLLSGPEKTYSCCVLHRVLFDRDRIRYWHPKHHPTTIRQKETINPCFFSERNGTGRIVSFCLSRSQKRSLNKPKDKQKPWSKRRSVFKGEFLIRCLEKVTKCSPKWRFNCFTMVQSAKNPHQNKSMIQPYNHWS